MIETIISIVILTVQCVFAFSLCLGVIFAAFGLFAFLASR